jgi:hypothetical protein
MKQAFGNSMRREYRVWFAFAGASIITAIFVGSAAPLSGVYSGSSIAWSVVAIAPWCGTFVIGVGGPLYLLCEKFGLVTWWSTLLGGAIGGVLVASLFAWPKNATPQNLSLFAAAGLCSGLVFWLLYPAQPKARNDG